MQLDKSIEVLIPIHSVKIYSKNKFADINISLLYL